MTRFRPTGKPRRLALFVALFFAALTLMASRPHSHTATFSKAGAAPAFTTDASSCLLCSWLTTSYVAPSVAAPIAAAVAVQVAYLYSVAVVSLCSLRVPHRGLRAPPLRPF